MESTLDDQQFQISLKRSIAFHIALCTKATLVQKDRTEPFALSALNQKTLTSSKLYTHEADVGICKPVFNAWAPRTLANRWQLLRTDGVSMIPWEIGNNW